MSGKPTTPTKGKTMSERWLPVVGFEGLYEVSDLGHVRSLDRLILRPDARRTKSQFRRGAPMTRFPHSQQGHLQVHLSKDGRGRALSVHVLVLEAFVGPRPVGLCGLHANDIPTDNRLSNLRWGSISENGYDAVRNGRHPNSRKTHCKHGHEYTPENTGRTGRGTRFCRTCSRGYERNKNVA